MIDAKAKSQQLQMKMDPLKADLKSKKDEIRHKGVDVGQEQAQLQRLEKNVTSLQVI
jgi:hypothetical protein